MGEIMRFKSKIVATVAASVLFITGGTAAAASVDNVERLSDETSRQSIQDQYTHEEILELLFNGTGRIANENPQLLERLNFADNHEKADPDKLAEVIDTYLRYHKTFEQDVLEPLTSGDPRLVEAGLTDLTSNYIRMLEDEYDVEVQVASTQSDGCGAGAWVCVIAYVGGFVNVALYANAAVATLAVVALAIVPAAITYLMEEDAAESNIVKTELIAEFTRALAK
ncbi:hypothetical protein [Georgenia yuyongxinii]